MSAPSRRLRMPDFRRHTPLLQGGALAATRGSATTLLILVRGPDVSRVAVTTAAGAGGGAQQRPAGGHGRRSPAGGDGHPADRPAGRSPDDQRRPDRAACDADRAAAESPVAGRNSSG